MVHCRVRLQQSAELEKCAKQAMAELAMFSSSILLPWIPLIVLCLGKCPDGIDHAVAAQLLQTSYTCTVGSGNYIAGFAHAVVAKLLQAVHAVQCAAVTGCHVSLTTLRKVLLCNESAQVASCRPMHADQCYMSQIVMSDMCIL